MAVMPASLDKLNKKFHEISASRMGWYRAYFLRCFEGNPNVQKN
jgi:hypothetical protein